MLDSADIFTHRGTRKRVYSLASWTVIHKVRGWYYRKTDSDAPYKGPYSSEQSVVLMLARELKCELLRRDGLLS